MSFYLPIAEIQINILVILFFGFLVGFMSGLFGVGGGFLMTPLLIFMGIPPSTAVGTEAVQILGSSVSGAIAHGRKKNIDYEIGIFLLIGGIFGSTVGVIIFNFLKESGNIDLIINILYVIFLATIGVLMLIESTLSILRKDEIQIRKKKRRTFSDYLPMKLRFKRSKIYISIFLPLTVGIIVGLLSALMGVGGGFIMVPAMIYLFRMNTISAIGTSLFQIVFITLNVSILQATYNQSVDLILAIFLLIGGVIGAQFGSKLTSRFRGEQIRVLLAIIVMIVCFCMGLELISEPSMNSRIIIRGTN
ncbi:MAG: permease [Rickettsiales bacterium]|nr:permease [Rickettsiales bacterium]|tara:strand:- start:459 stop:1373 length:915 start_codon:yes stop_codon:yes gene_type:complete